jgi:lauroyl/myristoyl acyltransferase
MSSMNLDRIEIMDRDMAKVLAAKTERERLQIAWGMWRSVRRMLTRLITAENPDWSEELVQAEVRRRMAGTDVPEIDWEAYQ